MKKTIFLFFALIVTSKGYASTEIYFEGDKAVISIRDQDGNLEASKLYEKIGAPAIKNGTSLVKKISYKHRKQTPAFDLSCEIYASNEDLGECVLTIFKFSSNMDFEPNVPNVAFSISSDVELLALSYLFTRATDDFKPTFPYFSADRKLTIDMRSNGLGYGSFMIVYRKPLTF